MDLKLKKNQARLQLGFIVTKAREVLSGIIQVNKNISSISVWPHFGKNKLRLDFLFDNSRIKK